jgi:hypothetical protein
MTPSVARCNWINGRVRNLANRTIPATVPTASSTCNQVDAWTNTKNASPNENRTRPVP